MIYMYIYPHVHIYTYMHLHICTYIVHIPLFSKFFKCASRGFGGNGRSQGPWVENGCRGVHSDGMDGLLVII